MVGLSRCAIPRRAIWPDTRPFLNPRSMHVYSFISARILLGPNVCLCLLHCPCTFKVKLACAAAVRDGIVPYHWSWLNQLLEA